MKAAIEAEIRKTVEKDLQDRYRSQLDFGTTTGEIEELQAKIAETKANFEKTKSGPG